MKVIWHQTPSKKSYAIFTTCLKQHLNEGLVVAIFMKNLLPTVTPIDQMIATVVN
jgi:hypothetical protein